MKKEKVQFIYLFVCEQHFCTYKFLLLFTMFILLICLFVLILFFAAISQIIAFICWLIQFYQYLTHNVLALDDRNQNWYSKELAQLGHSFFLVLAGIILVVINLIILCVVVSLERKERRTVHEEPVDEKMAGAIMLY